MQRRWTRPTAVTAEAAGQVGLFDRRAHKSVAATSHAAHRKHLASGANAKQAALALACVKAHADCTITELTRFAAAATPTIDRYLFSRRLPELERAGLVVRTGERACHVTGRLCTTWRAR